MLNPVMTKVADLQHIRVFFKRPKLHISNFFMHEKNKHSIIAKSNYYMELTI